MPDTCAWIEDIDGVYHTGCGNAFFFDTAGPSEHGFKFCPHCGKQLVGYGQTED